MSGKNSKLFRRAERADREDQKPGWTRKVLKPMWLKASHRERGAIRVGLVAQLGRR